MSPAQVCPRQRQPLVFLLVLISETENVTGKACLWNTWERRWADPLKSLCED